MQRSLKLGIFLSLIALLLPAGTPASHAAVPCTTFPATGKLVCEPFLSYWSEHGGLQQQGLPLTEAFTETNAADNRPYMVQYFERARLEYHPEQQSPYDILPGLIGREQFSARYPRGSGELKAEPFSQGPGAYECVEFATTGERLCGPFLRYWQEQGGLERHGYPISPVFLELNPTDGQRYRTQYFERARFEYHDGEATETVLLGLLGREQLAGRFVAPPPAGASPTPSPKCDPAYPTVCIPPPPPILGCGQVPFRNFVVLPPDPHNFDPDGNGIGCQQR